MWPRRCPGRRSRSGRPGARRCRPRARLAERGQSRGGAGGRLEEVTARCRYGSHAGPSSHGVNGCNSNLRTNSSKPSDWSRILPADGEDVVALIDGRAVDADRDPVALAEAIDAGPFAQGLSTSSLPRVSSNSLKSGSCRDHQSWRSPVKILRLAAVLPARPLVGPENDLGLVSRTGIVPPPASLPRITIRSPTQPWASWHSIDDIHVPPAPPSGPGRIQEDAGVAHELAAVGPLAPLVFDDQVIVAVCLRRWRYSRCRRR